MSQLRRNYLVFIVLSLMLLIALSLIDGRAILLALPPFLLVFGLVSGYVLGRRKSERDDHKSPTR